MSGMDRMDFLETKLDYLQKEKNETLRALESVIETGDLGISLNKLKDTSSILSNAHEKVSKLVRVRHAGFLLVDENSGIFTPSWFEPEDCRDELSDETDRLIMDNTFALAIKANRCMTTRSSKMEGTILIHSLSTVSRTRGMFVCLLDMSKDDIPDAVFSLITMVMNSAAHMLESFELYNRNRVTNELLNRSVKSLELSEVHLKSFNEKLELEVEARTKELMATNELLENEVSERKKIEKLLVQQKNALESLNETLENRVVVETENRRKTEHMVQEQSKLAAMGQMLSAISHQWRQPLNSLGMIVQDILDEHEENGISTEYLDDSVGKAVKLIMHMSSTIDDFCDLVKTSEYDDEFNVYDCAREVSHLVEKHYNELGIFPAHLSLTLWLLRVTRVCLLRSS
jgi:hypothetical protein